MHIIIVGAGITGLSTYLHLTKHLPSNLNYKITIFESHKPRPSPTPSTLASTTFDYLSTSTSLVGGGLGISPNGMRVLATLDLGLHRAVIEQGFTAENFVFKGANGWTLGVTGTGDGDVKDEGEEEGFCVASSRQGLWEALMREVGEGVVRYKRVVDVGRDEQTGRILVTVDSDEGPDIESADLVIGADGVRSVVRDALFGDEAGKYKPEYTGLSGVGGFLNHDIPEFVAEKKAMVFTFGGNGFFGYSSGAPVEKKSLMWWSTFETSALPTTKNIDTAAIKADLLERHKNWKDPVIQKIVQNAEIQSIYPTWVLGELPYWGKDGIVLVGDAAHALDPTTGQGASQGLEDSQTLALLLSRSLRRSEEGHFNEKEAIAVALKLFYEIRNPRVQEIVERGRKLSGNKANVGIVKEYTMYFFLWLMMKYPSIGKLLLGDVNRELYAWSAEDEVQKAFKKMDDDRFEELRLRSAQ